MYTSMRSNTQNYHYAYSRQLLSSTKTGRLTLKQNRDFSVLDDVGWATEEGHPACKHLEPAIPKGFALEGHGDPA